MDHRTIIKTEFIHWKNLIKTLFKSSSWLSVLSPVLELDVQLADSASALIAPSEQEGLNAEIMFQTWPVWDHPQYPERPMEFTL